MHPPKFRIYRGGTWIQETDVKTVNRPGETCVTPRDDILASCIGMLPGTVMYVYIGSLAGDLATIGVGHRFRTPAEWTLYMVGLSATLGVPMYVTRLTRAAPRDAWGGMEPMKRSRGGGKQERGGQAGTRREGIR